MPIARKHAAASKGDTGPKPKLSANKFANKPAIMAMRPLPRNIAFEKVKDSHCASKPLCKRAIHATMRIKNTKMNDGNMKEIHILCKLQDNPRSPTD